MPMAVLDGESRHVESLYWMLWMTWKPLDEGNEGLRIGMSFQTW